MQHLLTESRLRNVILRFEPIEKPNALSMVAILRPLSAARAIAANPTKSANTLGLTWNCLNFQTLGTTASPQFLEVTRLRSAATVA
jgi:hypothetical protein